MDVIKQANILVRNRNDLLNSSCSILIVFKLSLFIDRVIGLLDYENMIDILYLGFKVFENLITF